jgi:hypothetical protein
MSQEERAPRAPRQLIAEGNWRAKCVDAVTSETRAGDAQVVLQFELLSGADAGKTIAWWGGFKTPKGQDFTLKALRTCGWDESGFGAEALLSCRRNEVTIVVQHETGDDGVRRDRVAFVNEAGLGGLVKKKLSPGGIADLERRCGIGRSVASAGPSAPGGYADEEYGMSPEDDSNLPF